MSEKNILAPVISISEWRVQREAEAKIVDPSVYARRLGYKPLAPQTIAAMQKVIKSIEGPRELSFGAGFKYTNTISSRVQRVVNHNKTMEFFNISLSKEQFDIINGKINEQELKAKVELEPLIRRIHLVSAVGRSALLKSKRLIYDPSAITPPVAMDNMIAVESRANWQSITSWRAVSGLAINAISSDIEQQRSMKNYLDEVGTANYMHDKFLEAAEEEKHYSSNQRRISSQSRNFILGITNPLTLQETRAIIDMPSES